MSFKFLSVVMVVFLSGLTACTGSNDSNDNQATVIPATDTPEPEVTPEATETVLMDDAQPYMGINFNPNNPNGFEVFVDSNSPAEKAGIQNGDLILAVDGQPVNPDNIVEVFGDYRVGDVLTMTVRRDDEELEFDITLEAAPEVETPVLRITQPFAGLLMIVDGESVTIDDVMAGSPADKAGLQSGDVIIEANGVALEEPGQVFNSVQSLMPGMELQLSVLRDEEPLEFSLVLTAPTDNESTQQEVALTDSIDFLEDEGVYLVENAPANGILARILLQEGDRIISIDGEILQPADLFSRVNQTTPQDIITLEIERDGSRVIIDSPGFAMPTLAAAAQINEADSLPLPGNQQPSGPLNLPSFVNPPGQNNDEQGAEQDNSQLPPFLRSQNVTPPPMNFPPLTNANQLGIAYNILGDTLLITSVVPGSPAQSAGIAGGDVIIAVNGEEVADAAQLQNVLENIEEIVVISVQRANETLEFEISLTRTEEQTIPDFFGEGGPPIATPS